MNDIKAKTLKVRLVKSLIGKRASHRQILSGMGLKRINSTAILQDNPSIKGMLNKVAYMIKVE